MMLAALHWSTLGQVVGVSILAGIGESTVFSLVILASARATEHRRTGNGIAALGFGVLGTLAFLVFAAGIVFSVHVLLQK